MKTNVKFFQSNAAGEGMTVEYYAKDDEFWLAFWEATFPLTKKPGWGFLDRLKFAWNVLWKSKLWTDMLIFDRETAKNIAYHILYRLEQTEENLSDNPDKLF